MTDLDCELLGTCQADGTCRCAPGFRGTTCGQLDLQPMAGTLSAQPGKVWPRSTTAYYPQSSNHITIGWSFAPVYNPASKRYVAAIEIVCDAWSTPVWIAAVSSDRPDGGWVFDRRLGQYGTNCPHMKLLPNGTFALIFNAHASSQYYPANATAPGNPPICVGNVTRPPSAAMEPAAGFLPCGPDESPEQGHNCLCSRASKHCNFNTSISGTYMATTENWPDGPWRMSPLQIMGKVQLHVCACVCVCVFYCFVLWGL